VEFSAHGALQVLGIYDVRAKRVHYYDSMLKPSESTTAIVEVFLKTTVKQLNAKLNLGQVKTNFVRHADTTYPKQSDGTSCGFFVCYYVEAFLTLRRSTGFFMADTHFIYSYRIRVLEVLLAISSGDFPAYIPLSGFVDGYSRARTQPTATRATARSMQASQMGIAASVQSPPGIESRVARMLNALL
jgi:hypothetical protein